MTGKFDQFLKLIWNGKGVEARGPLEWDDEDTSLSLHVAIMQNDVAATGRTGDDVPRSATEFLLVAGVQGNGTLKEGPAIATGWAQVRGDSVEMYEWSVPVTLTESQPAAGLGDDLSPAKKSRTPA
jgi:hypothetical protein